jgi:hypothetical protein
VGISHHRLLPLKFLLLQAVAVVEVQIKMLPVLAAAEPVE